MSDRVFLCGDTGQYLPCAVCKGRRSHYAACPVPVLGAPQTEEVDA